MKRFERVGRATVVELTIVCAVRNAAHCLSQLLDSYRRERVDGVEMIVLDGDSTDQTWQIATDHSDLIDLAISDADAGIYDAWNKALPLSRGRWLAFIGSDDLLARGSLTALLSACRGETGGDAAHIVAGFNVLTRRSTPVALLGANYDHRKLMQRMMIAQVMSAHRRDWLLAVGGFDASYRSSGDYELLLRERSALRVKVIPEILAFMEDGGISRTRLRPFTENFRARRSQGCSTWSNAALFARAIAGRTVRRLLRR